MLTIHPTKNALYAGSSRPSLRIFPDPTQVPSTAIVQFGMILLPVQSTN